MNEITCPATNKYMIAVYVISGVVGQSLRIFSGPIAMLI